MDLHTLTIVTDGTVAGTTIKVNDDIIAGVQQFDISIKADPVSTVQASIRYWRAVGTTVPLTVEGIKTHLVSAFGVYATPFTDVLELANEPLVFTPAP
jgi:hypothetical protein